MSSLDRAAELRAQADALDALATLETELRDAKQAYEDDPSEENKTAKNDAALKLRAARAETRPEGTTVGGDAFVTPDDEIPQSVQPAQPTITGQEG